MAASRSPLMSAPDPRHVQLVPLRDSLVGRVLRGSGNVTYHLRECIGEGGQGWVFRANWDDPSGHVVIVKVLRPDVVATEALRRFQREAEVLRMLSTQARPNPYVVRFYDHAVAQVPSPYGPDPLSMPFTVLEYVDGTTLEKVLRDHKNQGLGAERTRRLLRQMCQALDMVHGQKVVHRDFKPSNILLATEAGNEIAKVTDFGLVKLVEMNLQKTTALAGASLGYAPPEQYEQGNQRVSPKTDIFSLAAVTFEMLSGRPAFPFIEGENPLLIVTRILNGPRPTLMKTRNSLSPELEGQTALIEALDRELTRALAADPAARHDSVMDFWSAIEPTLRSAAEERTSPDPRGRVSGFEATAKVPSDVDGVSYYGGSPGSPGPVAATTPAQGAVRVGGSSRGGTAPHGTPRKELEDPSRQRVPEIQAANPAAWTWNVLSGPFAPQAVRAAAFSPTGDKAVAVTTSGLMRWDRGAWIPMPVPAHVRRDAIRGVRWLPGASVLLYGDGGLVAHLSPAGLANVWRVPDQEITFHGAHVDELSGLTTLVGERPYRGGAVRPVPGNTAGVVSQFAGDRLTVMGDAMSCTRLRAVTRLASGLLVACGDWGAIVRVELGIVEQAGSICGGHLLAIAPLPDGGAVTVGAGGHALSLSPKLDAQLEAVQTTRDLLAVATSDDGQAWTGSVQARLLRRGAAGNPTWIRMSGEIGVTASMIAVHADRRVIRAVGDDGTVVEGRIA